MQTRFHSVVVGGYPHVRVLVHSAVGYVKHIIIVANLSKSSSANIIRKKVGKSGNIDKSIPNKVTILIAPVIPRFQCATFARCGLVDIATGIYIDFAARRSKDNAVVHFDRAIEYLAVFVAVVFFTLIVNEAVAKSCQQTGFFVKVVPIIIRMVVLLDRNIAANDEAVFCYPIGSLIQHDPFVDPKAFTEVITGAIFLFNKRSADQNTNIVEHKLLAIHGGLAGNGSEILRREIVQSRAVQRRSPACV